MLNCNFSERFVYWSNCQPSVRISELAKRNVHVNRAQSKFNKNLQIKNCLNLFVKLLKIIREIIID